MYRLISYIKRYMALAVIHIFNLLPVKKNKIFFFSYYGSQYGCNPKYITEYIMKNCPENKFDMVWAFNTPESMRNLKGFRKVKNMSLRYFYELCTSKIIITNFRTTEFFIKRKEQYYIQTWHSSLRLKQIEKDAEDSLTEKYVEMAKQDSFKCDVLLSGCEYSTRIFRRAFWYDGNILEGGTPRNDLLFEENSSAQVTIHNTYEIAKECKIILYAPTFRKNTHKEIYDLDYLRILDKIRDTFGGKWILVVRLHPHIASESRKYINRRDIIDATSYNDVQELLGAADILISDYSSLIFDFMLTKRPCFLYTPDVSEYIKNDRRLYFDIGQLPFSYAVSNNELEEKIQNFNIEKYREDLLEFSNKIGTYEDGKACERLVNHINSICFN